MYSLIPWAAPFTHSLLSYKFHSPPPVSNELFILSLVHTELVSSLCTFALNFVFQIARLPACRLLSHLYLSHLSPSSLLVTGIRLFKTQLDLNDFLCIHFLQLSYSAFFSFCDRWWDAWHSNVQHDVHLYAQGYMQFIIWYTLCCHSENHVRIQSSENNI